MAAASVAAAATAMGGARVSGVRARGFAANEADSAENYPADGFAGFRMMGERRVVDALFDLKAFDFHAFSSRGGFVEVNHGSPMSQSTKAKGGKAESPKTRLVSWR